MPLTGSFQDLRSVRFQRLHTTDSNAMPSVIFHVKFAQKVLLFNGVKLISDVLRASLYSCTATASY